MTFLCALRKNNFEIVCVGQLTTVHPLVDLNRSTADLIPLGLADVQKRKIQLTFEKISMTAISSLTDLSKLRSTRC